MFRSVRVLRRSFLRRSCARILRRSFGEVGGSATDHAVSGGAVIAVAGINLVMLVTISQCPEEPDMDQCRDSKNRQRSLRDNKNIVNISDSIGLSRASASARTLHGSN